MLRKSLCESSPEDITAALKDPRMLLMPCVRVLASSFLSDLRHYESLTKSWEEASQSGLIGPEGNRFPAMSLRQLNSQLVSMLSESFSCLPRNSSVATACNRP